MAYFLEGSAPLRHIFSSHLGLLLQGNVTLRQHLLNDKTVFHMSCDGDLSSKKNVNDWAQNVNFAELTYGRKFQRRDR